ncbi:MAG TPA: phosphotransferase [Candidatus Eisenbacteria bacterium]
MLDAWSAERDLPRTLLHGDAKVANFALMPDSRVAELDWALVGAGPASVDLGRYLAVNASRLARPKEEAVARYRTLLAERLGGEGGMGLVGGSLGGGGLGRSVG